MGRCVNENEEKKEGTRVLRGGWRERRRERF